MVDCPHRERMGYGGDAHATMETAMTNFGVGGFYTKWLGDWRDVQNPTAICPTRPRRYFGGGGPAWSGICVTLPWQVYLHDGDRRVLEKCYPMMQRWLEFLETKAKPTNSSRGAGYGISRRLGTARPRPGPRQARRRPLDADVQQLLLRRQRRHRGQGRRSARQAEEAAAYRKEADAIAAATQKAFFQPENNNYANGTQLYEAMPLLFGITPPPLRAAVLDRLADEILVQKKRAHRHRHPRHVLPHQDAAGRKPQRPRLHNGQPEDLSRLGIHARTRGRRRSGRSGTATTPSCTARSSRSAPGLSRGSPEFGWIPLSRATNTSSSGRESSAI